MGIQWGLTIITGIKFTKIYFERQIIGKMELTIQFDGGWGNIALIYILYKH